MMSNNFESEINSVTPPPSIHLNSDDEAEDECVICLEPLSTAPWGRCLPCKHGFHKECWWKWEVSHYERLEREIRRRGNNTIGLEDHVRCCLCNAVNEQFVDENGAPAPNPSDSVPRHARETSANSNTGPRSPRRNILEWLRDLRSQRNQDSNTESDNVERERRDRESRSRQRQEWRNDEARENARSFLENLQQQSASILGGLDPRAFAEQVERDWGPSPFGSTPRDNNRSDNNNNTRSGTDAYASEFWRNLSRSMGMDPEEIMEQFTRAGMPNSPPTSPPRRTEFSSNTTASNPSHTEFNTFPNGTPVILRNLVNSSHLNGKEGKILRYLPTSASYLVQLDSGSQSPVAVKQDNILQQVKITIRGIQSQPHLNGRAAIVCSHDRERNRYIVKFTRLSSIGTGCNREISIQPCNMHIPEGTTVRLEGLTRHSQWNGKWGKVVRLDDDGRYEVRISRLYSVRVKMENVRL
mmetsp:Transcript_24545/g.52114  ORF Transcript_24545/g.52114 Transcript_24545/m.52114 type:complete len:469 (-) Transcript_24545:17-1423(-)